MARYPRELSETVSFAGEPITIRPIRPEDEPAHRAFFESLEPEDIRFRFFGAIREARHEQLARLTRIDYEREMAFVAVDARGRTLGVIRLVKDPEGDRAEFAVVIRSNLKGRGLGRLLLEKGVRYCRQTGVASLVGQVLRANARMLALARDLEFEVRPSDEDGIHEVVLSLDGEDGKTGDAS